MTALHLCSLETLLHMLREGSVTCTQLTRHYMDRIRTFGQLNAVRIVSPEALIEARELDSAGDRSLPLFGLPILVKDNIDVRGLPTTAGSAVLSGHIARDDAPIIRQLRKQGAVILGKTNMTEFANYTTQGMPNGFSSLGGQVMHAYGSSFNPGGSSSGSGVAVSAGLCAAAIGTDTSFSIVACAAANGISGIKPAHGALSLKGIVPIASTLDSPGPMARTLPDALHLLNALLETPGQPLSPLPVSRLRLAVNTANGDRVAPEQRMLYDTLMHRLQTAGAYIEEICQPPTPHQKHIMRCEFRRDLEAYLAASDAPVKTLKEIVTQYETNAAIRPYGITCLDDALNSSVQDEAYQQAMQARKALADSIPEELMPFDCCLMTGPTNIMHFLGLPSLTLPLAMGADGSPKGLILYGADQSRLLQAALAIAPHCPGVTPPFLP